MSNLPTVSKLIESQKKQIQAALPKHLSAERMSRIALTELRKNPELSVCDPLSFLGAIIQCSQLGLEPGSALGHAYLIPFNDRKAGKKQVQLIIGYRGLIDLARRSGQIKSISARPVFENDTFKVQYGLHEDIVHHPAQGERGELTHVYAVAQLKDGGVQFELMSRYEIDQIAKPNPVWKSHYEEMAKKTVIRRLFKYLPVSIEYSDIMTKVTEIEDASDNKYSQGHEEILINAGVTPIEEEKDNVLELSKAKGKDAEEDLKYKLIDQIDDFLGEKEGEINLREIEERLGIKFDELEGLPVKSLQAIAGELAKL